MKSKIKSIKALIEQMIRRKIYQARHGVKKLSATKKMKNKQFKFTSLALYNYKTKLIYTILIITIFCGAFAGAIMANIIESSQYEEITEYLNKFMNSFLVDELNKNSVLAESIIKYSKTALIIWIMGFIPYGVIITEVLLFTRGLTCGFTTALLIRQLGFKGILFASASYVPQNILILPMYIALSFYSIKQIKIKETTRRRRSKINILKDYIMILIICLIITILSSIIEVYISPVLMEMTITK